MNPVTCDNILLCWNQNCKFSWKQTVSLSSWTQADIFQVNQKLVLKISTIITFYIRKSATCVGTKDKATF